MQQPGLVPSDAEARHESPPRLWAAEPDRGSQPGLQRLTAVAVFVFVLLAYLLFPNQNYGLDSAWYAYEARHAEDLFHPHHLLYNGFGYLLNRLVSAVHPVDTIALLAFSNGVISAAMILSLYLTLRRLVGRTFLAAGFALLCAFASGVWQMATTVEVYPMTLLCEVTALLLLWRPLSPLRVIAAGALCGAGMLFHQTGIFFAPVLALLIYQETRSVRRAAAALLIAFGVVTIPYVVVAYGKGVRTPAQLAHWLVSYTDSPQYRAGMWGGGLSPRQFILAPFGLCVALFSPVLADAFRTEGPLQLPTFDVIATLPLVVFIGAAVYLLASALRASKAVDGAAPDTPMQRNWRRAMLLWMLLHGAFTAWWEPGNAEFWLMLFPALAIALSLQARVRFSALSSAPYLMAVLVGTELIGNFFSRIHPNAQRERNAALQIMSALAQHGPRGDAVVVFGMQNELSTYTKYFWGPRRAATTNSLAFSSFASAAERPAALLRYQAQVAEIVRQGGAYLLESELSPPLLQLAAPPYWTAEEYRRVYAPFVARAQYIGSYRSDGRAFQISYLPPP